MVKSTKKRFLSLLNLLICFAIFCCITACGSGGTRGTEDTTTGTGRQIASFTASPTSLSSGQTSILTVNVTDSKGVAVNGATITFSFVTNNSGGTLTVQNGGTTDAGGKAMAIYTAGATTPASSLEDTIEATCESATQVLIITRTAASSVHTGSLITVTPTPVSLVAGALSAIVAQVNDASGNPVAGETVTFALQVNNSGATLSPLTATTDGSGKALSIYTAGSNSPSLEIDDAVSASVTGASGAAIITRLPAAGTGNRIISFTQTPKTCNDGSCTLGRIKSPDYNVQMTVKVTTNDNTTPVKNKEVLFSIVIGDGTIFDTASNTAGAGDPPLTVSTDDNGEAWVTFARPEAGIGDTVVRAQIEGTTNGGDAASIVYWKGIMPSLKLEASSTTVIAGGTSTLTATVTDDAGTAIINAHVTFTIAVNNSSAPALVVLNANTDSSGHARATYTAGATAPAIDNISASTTYYGFDASDAVNITVTP